MKTKLRLSDFDYELDESLIAQHPPEKRDGARMLVLEKRTGAVSHKEFRDFIEYIRPHDLIVINDTKVMPARLFGNRPGREESIEVLLLKRLPEGEWEVLVRPGKKMKVGTIVEFGGGILQAEVLTIQEDGNRRIRFTYEGIWEELLDQLGKMPLPPYIHEKLADQSRYQTVYAKYEGSAAAPTAGLHFTEETMRAIKEKGVRVAPVTLHVGLGTFRPVKTDDPDEHQMHSEWYSVSAETASLIKETKRAGGRVIAIGTTSLRVLESVGEALLGAQAQAYSGWTSLFVKPGFRFAIADALLTNFHLPKSTLLMLVSAFSTREHILHAYQIATKERYRFFSFGDCMFLYEETQ